MTDDENEIKVYTNDELIDAVKDKDKHNIPLATGVYRKAHMDLVLIARRDERARVVKWLRLQSGHFADVYTELADDIEDGTHLEDVRL
jgi:hypothetical protein